MVTRATFAGLECTDVRFSRSRGYDSDLSVVEIPVENFPDGLQLVAAEPGQVGGAIPVNPFSPSPKRPEKLEPLKQSRLVFAGTLWLYEAEGDRVFPMPPIHPLYVKEVQRIRASRKGGVARLRVTLVDPRYFPRGFLRVWSYNRVRADLQVARDSVKSDGKPYTLAEIADAVAAAMFLAPKLANVPEAWKSRSPAMEFPPFGAPVAALAELERTGGSEPPCLHLDGSVGIYRLGEGKVGWAPNGAGTNSQPFPLDLRLWKQGTGEGHTIELSYPDDYVCVRGLERVQTVALDDCEPVLMIRVSSANPDRPAGSDVGTPDGATGGPAQQHAPADLDAAAKSARARADAARESGDLVVRDLLEQAAQDAEKAARRQGGQRQRVVDVEPVEDFDLGEPRVLPLTDEVVRALTGDKLNLTSLRRWVLQPRVYQDVLGLEERIARVLRDQAWRLWRVPGVVVYDTGGGPAGALTPQAQALLDRVQTANAQGESVRKGAVVGGAVAGLAAVDNRGAAPSADPLNPSTRPGPNASVLPLLPCAETVDGRRVPILVQTWRFRARHQVLVGKGQVSQRGTRARQRMAEILNEADRVADLKQVQPVREGGSATFGGSGWLTAEQLGSAQVIAVGGTMEDFMRAVSQARLLDRLRELDGTLATQYETELRANAEATSKLRGTPDVQMLELAKKAVNFEKQIAEAADEINLEIDLQATDLLSGNVEFDLDSTKRLDFTSATQADVKLAQERQKAFFTSIQSELRGIERAREDRKIQERSGVAREDAIPPEYGPIFIDNLPRTRDHGARLYSAELGIFEVSSLPGHLSPTDVPEPAMSYFYPMPVRVCFGTVVRPKLVDPKQSRTQAAGRENRAGDLRDAPTWFTRCFRRGRAPGDAIQIELRDVPFGEGVTIPLNQHELIPLAGSGNTERLEVEALELAKDRFRPKPRLEEQTYALGGPWPVNCDGIVRGVQINMRPGGKGFETTISVGSGTWDPNPARTRVRPRQARKVDDGLNREGTRP